MKIAMKYAVYVGLDWADKKHDVCIQASGQTKREFKVIEHSPESIDCWVKSLYKKYKGKIAIAVELDKGPVIFALQKYPFVTVFPIHAATLAKYRETFTASGAKNDPRDAEIALELLLNYPEKFKPLERQGDTVRKLEILVEKRRGLVDDKRRFVNQLICALKHYYPQTLDWFSHRNTELFCDFIVRWPTLQQFKRAHEQTIRRFFKSYGGQSMVNINYRLEQRKNAMHLTEDAAVIEPYQLLAKSLASLIKASTIAIREFDKQIAKLFHESEDSKIFESLPGVGICLGPRLLVVFGEDRSRFNNACDLQAYTGVAPVTVSSGQKTWIHWRWQCAKFVRQTIIEWSEKSVRSSYWASLYYEQQRAKGNSHQAAVRALAFKWIRIVFKCWKDKKPYDETKYLKALRKRNSPLVC
jgi:transposase